VAATAATLRSFAAPPGRKVMLLLSGGWPYSPATYAVNDPSRPVDVERTKQGTELYAPFTDTANLLGYTVYPVDVPGLGAEFAVDAENGSPLQSALLNQAGPRITDTSIAGSRERERDVEQALNLVAKQTGGQALINAKRLDALPEVVEDTRSYYWIGFTPQRNRDDKLHDIRVESTRPGLKVRSRRDFRDLSRGAESDMEVESALLFGNAPASGALRVSLGTPEPSGRHLMEVPIEIDIPVAAITIVPVGGAFVAKLELRVAALDADSRKSDVPAVPLELSFKSQPPADGVIPFKTRFKLRKAKQTLVVSVNDPLSGHSLTTRVEVSP
jgi:hypothetical protein